GKPFMDEPVNPTVKVDRLVEAEVVPPDGDDDDDSDDKPEPPTQVTPPKPPQPVEDVQLKKAFEIIRQAPAKGVPAKRAAAIMRPPESLEEPAEPRITT